MDNMPKCPKCGGEYVYEDGPFLICPECAYEWSAAEEAAKLEGIDFLLEFLP